MYIRTCFVSLMLLIAANTGSASPPPQQGLRGPVMGYVLDATRQVIHPISGIPRSSLLGTPLDLSFPVAAAAFSPKTDFALVVSAAGDHSAYILLHLDTEPEIESIPGAIAGADRLVFNADASIAVLLASREHQIQIVRGLPGSIEAEPPVDLSSIAGTITTLALDKSGTNILLAASGDSGALYLVSTTSDSPQIPRWIANFGSPAGLALLNNDRDVIVADAALDELTLILNFADAAQAVRLADERDGISSPTALHASSDGSRLYIVDGGGQAIDVWNFDKQSIETRLELDVQATRLTLFQSSSTFLINDVGGHPLLMLDAAATPSEIYFVPAPRD